MGCPHQAEAPSRHQTWRPPDRRAGEELALVHTSWEKGLWRGRALKKLLPPPLGPDLATAVPCGEDGLARPCPEWVRWGLWEPSHRASPLLLPTELCSPSSRQGVHSP